MFYIGVVFSLAFTPAHFLNSKISSYDDASYLAHAYTLGLDFDLDYTNEIAIRFNRNKNLPSHAIGSGILAAPFVGLFGILDRVSSHDVIKNRAAYFGSWSFFGFLFSCSAYFLFGVLLFYRSLRFMDPDYSFGFHILLILSTGITYYVLGRFTMSHSFEFFSFAGTVFSSVNLYKKIYKGEQYNPFLMLMTIGFFAVLNLWIRPANINGLLLPFICLVTLSITHSRTIDIRYYFGILGSILLFLVPYSIFSLMYYNQIFPTYSEAYSVGAGSFGPGVPNNLFDISVYVIGLLPNILLIFFSSEFGILYTNPTIIIGLMGFVVLLLISLGSHSRLLMILLLVMVIIYCGVSFSIVLIWKTTASDYGYRYLFAIIPVAMLFTVFLLRHLKDLRKASFNIIKCVIILAAIIGVLNVFFYKTTPSLAPREQQNVFGVWHGSSVKGYEYNLIQELKKYPTYVLGIGKSYYGMLLASYVLDTRLTDMLSEEQTKKYLPRYRHIPQAIYYQTFILLLLWLSYGWYVGGFMENSREIDSTDSLL